MKPHRYAKIFPSMTQEEWGELMQSISQNGYNPAFPIVEFEGKILDGVHRFKACKALGIKPKIIKYRGDDPLGFSIAANFKRRHLTTTQRAAIMAEAATLRRGGDRGNQYTGGKPSNGGLAEKGLSAAEAAKIANVSTRSVERAKARMKADPKAHAAAKAGKKKAKKAKKKATKRKTSSAKKPPPRPAKPKPPTVDESIRAIKAAASKLKRKYERAALVKKLRRLATQIENS